jgi:hypothetical protein|tara:strand:+ start:651 stop:1220 length:570 start_codon:yes stop_codon:yes gene_type:complete
MSKEEVWDEIEADASKFDALTTEAGSELSEMIRILSDVTSAISKAEESVKSLKKSRDRYLHDLIPGKMAEMGLDKVEVDGNKVSLQTFVSGTMPKDPLERNWALNHLREIGAGDFIKNDVSVSFGVTQDNVAKDLAADLENKGYETSSKTWVEPMTLKKLIRERVEANQEIDLDIFNAHVGTIAKIKGA